MIDATQIEKNKKAYYASIKAYNVCHIDLVDKLADMGLFEAPASTMLNLHNAFPGGLVDHLIRVAGYAVKLNEMLPEALKQTKESVIRVSLLHGIGKTGLYTPCKSEWHIKNQGKMYEFNDDLVSMRVGERSAYYCSLHGVKLNEEEYQTIVNSDKGDNDLQSKYHSTPLAQIVKQGFELAIFEQKHG